MCGIAGIAVAATGGQPDATAIERMCAALVHRGPDDSGTWLGDRVALAMRRLRVIDLEGGKQPMMNDDGSVVLVFNGEIYNYRGLRETLEKRGHSFRTQSDTEVLLRGYEAYGDDVLTHLNGMFAFAIYDRKQERVLLARDRLGIKPLVYALRGDTLYFASELNALLLGMHGEPEINLGSLRRFVEFLYVPSPDTIYSGVSKLRAGEIAVFQHGALRTETYWKPAFAPDTAWDLDSAAERFLTLARDSISLQRVSDVPLGAFLSGGVDSSTVVGLLSEISDIPVQTYSIEFDDPEANELSYARIAARHFGTNHHETILKPDLATMCEHIAAQFGEPFADSSALPTWLVSQEARKGVTVALSGDGGDELFGGYTWMHMARRVEQYRRVPRLLRHAIDAGLHALPSGPQVARYRRFSRDSFLGPVESFRRRETCFTAAQVDLLFRPEVLQTVAEDRFRERSESVHELAYEEQMLFLDTTQYLPDDILAKVDAMSMAHSLEVRVPLLDHRIVEFAATVPFPLKYAGGVSKRVMKHAVRGLLPAELLAQRKRGFAIPIHRWFRESLGPYFEETVLSPKAYCNDYVNSAYVRDLFSQHLVRRENYGHHLWALLMLELWLRGNA